VTIGVTAHGDEATVLRARELLSGGSFAVAFTAIARSIELAKP